MACFYLIKTVSTKLNFRRVQSLMVARITHRLIQGQAQDPPLHS